MIRGVRGATTVKTNSHAAILDATQELLSCMVERNGIVEEDVASVLFTATPELDDSYPAEAARRMGWTRAALLGFQEANVKNGLPMCIRVLIHWNTGKAMDEIRHVFLHDAVQLRPEWADSTEQAR